ncbi:hypothetical protein [Paraburkholderia youngii]|uniref:hypothetical protein n=1 Tax=Paraburkholderia youngii TaxID=2782701 RepID=UPI003D1B725C
MTRPALAPQTEKIVCIYCSGCGMSTPAEPVGKDEKSAMTRCAHNRSRRLSRPKITEGDLRDLIEKELGACDSQMVIDMCIET